MWRQFHRPLLVASLCALLVGTGALAGSLTPSGPVGATMRSLADLYDAITGTFDSSGVVANQNGNFTQQLKYIEANLTAGRPASNSLDFDEFVNAMNLDANTTVASHGFSFSILGNVGIGAGSPTTALEVTGTAKATAFVGSGQSLTLARLGASTYSTVQELQNIFHSSGWVSGGAITDGGGGTVNVAAGTGLIRDVNSATSTVYYFDWAPATFGVPADTTRYLGVDYNGGTPNVVSHATADWNNRTNFPLGRVVNESGVLHIEADVFGVGDHAANMIQRDYETMPLARDDRDGGLLLGETGTRNITLSAGALWDRLNRYPISAFDSSAAGRFDQYYFNGAAWVVIAAQSQWPNTQYNDISSGLVSLTPGDYAVLWFYVETDGDMVMVFGRAQYATLVAAEAEGEPASLPPRIVGTGRLVGRLIFQNAASSAAEVQSAFSTTFSAGSLTSAAFTNLSNTFTAQNTFSVGVSVSGNFDVAGVASVSRLYGANLSTCGGNNVLQWTGGLFSCGLVNSFNGLAAHEGTAVPIHITDLALEPGSFNFSNVASAGVLRLDWTNGPASRSAANTWTALNTFSGGVSVSANLEVTGHASASQIFGAGLSTCGGSNVLQWTGGLFSCVPGGSGTFTGLATHEGGTVAAHITDLTFEAGAFNFSTLASGGIVRLDWTNGPASRSMINTWTAQNTFSGGVSISSSFEVSGVASVSSLFVGGAMFNASGSRPASNSLDFDEFVDAMNLDANTTVASHGFSLSFSDTNLTTGTILPDMGGAIGTLSMQNIGDSTHWYRNIYVESAHLGASSLYVNGTKIISSAATTMSFTTDPNQNLAITTSGNGNMVLRSNGTGNLQLIAQQTILASASNGITLSVPAINPSENLNLTNQSVGGQIGINATGASGRVLVGASDEIVLTATNVKIFGTASASFYTGAGLAACAGATQKLLWTGGIFSCGTDQTGGGGGGALIGLRTTGNTFTNKSSISFESGAFVMSFPDEALVKLNWGAGGPASLSQAETVTGLWNFSAPTSVSSNFEVSGNASASAFFGAGLTDCSNATGSKVLWTAATGKFSCGSDQQGAASAGGWTDDGTVVRLSTAADNVGIGTVNANQAKVEILGVASISGNLILPGAGNIGVGAGATTPADKITIKGTAGATGLEPLLLVASTSGTQGFAVNGRGNINVGYVNQNLLYNRFDNNTNATSNKGLNNTGDLLLGGRIEVVGVSYLTAGASISGGGLQVTGKIRTELAGTAALPSWVTFATDPGTGFYRPTTNIIGFTTAGVEAMRIDASGNVGIDTTSVTSKLRIVGTTGASKAEVLFATASISGTNNFQVNGNGIMMAGGNVNTSLTYNRFGATNAITTHNLSTGSDLLIGNSLEVDGATYLDSSASVSGNIHITGQYRTNLIGSVTAPSWVIYAPDPQTGFFRVTTNVIGITTAGVQAMEVNAAQNIQMGTTTDSGRLTVQGAAANAIAVFASGSGQNVFRVNKQGTVSIGYGQNNGLLYNVIGTSGSTHTSFLDASNDLMIGGSLEVDAMSFFDGGVTIGAASSLSGNLEITGQYRTSLAGSATAPSWVLRTTDPKTGMFSGGANIMAFTTNGTERMRIDAVGNVGIGTTTTTNAAFTFVSPNAGTGPIASIGSISGGPSIYITKSGAVELGTTSQIGTARRYNSVDADATNGGALRAEVNDTNDLYIADALETHGILQVDGNVSVSSDFEITAAGHAFILPTVNANANLNVPVLTFENDRDTGISHDSQNGPNRLAFDTAGTARMLLDPTGNLVLKDLVTYSTLGGARLDVTGSGSSPIAQFSSASNQIQLMLNKKGALLIGTHGNGGTTQAYNSVDVDPQNTPSATRSEINDQNDLYIADALQVSGIVDFGSAASLAGTLETTGVIKTPNGTAAAPPHTFSTDPATGVYLFGTGALGLSGGGVGHIRIDANGSIFGTPGAFTGRYPISIIDANKYKLDIGQGYNDTAAAPTTLASASYLQLGQGEYNANSYRLITFGLKGSTDTYAPAYMGYQENTPVTGRTKGDLVFGTRNDTASTTAPSERMRITSSGNIGIATAVPLTRVEIEGTASASNMLTSGAVQFNNGGATVSYSRFGVNTTTHSLSTPDSLMISGSLEADGTAFFDGAVTFAGGTNLGSTAITSVTNITGTGTSQFGIFSADNGSAAAPSYTFTNKTNTGMYLANASTGVIGLSSNGTLVASVRNDGLYSETGMDVVTGNVFRVGSTAGINRTGCGTGTRWVNFTFSGGVLTGSGTCEVDTAPDLAENYFKMDADLQAGMLVAPYASGNLSFGVIGSLSAYQQGVVRTTTAYQTGIIGIVSTNPGQILAAPLASGTMQTVVPVALAGRVPTRVTTANGQIKVGDHITTSDIPGIGMKATRPGMTVGIALEPTDSAASSSQQSVMVFISPSYWSPDISEMPVASASDSVLAPRDIPTMTDLFGVIVRMFEHTLNIVFQNGLIKTVTGMFSEVKTEKLCVDDACVTRQQFMQMMQQAGIATPTPSDLVQPTPPETPASVSMPIVETEPLVVTGSVSATVTPTPEATSTPETTAEPSATPTDTPGA